MSVHESRHHHIITSSIFSVISRYFVSICGTYGNNGRAAGGIGLLYQVIFLGVFLRVLQAVIIYYRFFSVWCFVLLRVLRWSVRDRIKATSHFQYQDHVLIPGTINNNAVVLSPLFDLINCIYATQVRSSSGTSRSSPPWR